MIVKARQIEDSDKPVPFGPFEDIDLDQATDLGVFERFSARGPKRTLLAHVGGKTYQVRDKDNKEHTRHIMGLKSNLPRPRIPCHVRWTHVPPGGKPYSRDDEIRMQRILFDKHGEMVADITRIWKDEPWDKYLERVGIRRALASWTSLGYSMVITDPHEPKSHRIFLTRDQAEKILVLGMP